MLDSSLYKNAMNYFYDICSIPHKSFHTKELKDFLIKKCENLGMNVSSDKSGNIYAYFQNCNPKICLQAHYDMVGVGRANELKPLDLEINNQFLKAKNSSLGADNGASVSVMLSLAEVFKNIELLFTNDEEVGLIGANNLELPIKSKYLLNLDAEFLGEIVVGCAGGFDANLEIDKIKLDSSFKYFYKINSFGFSGGHSGIDIDKDIKSSIVEFFNVIEKIDCELLDIKAGEKINSIPINLEALIATNDRLDEILYIDENIGFSFKEVNINIESSINKDILIKVIKDLKHGVHIKENHSVLSSLNIALIDNVKDKIILRLKARANKLSLLKDIESNINKQANILNTNAEFSNFYAPWQRELDSNHYFLKLLDSAFLWRCIEVCEIHAGLECGILKDKFNNMGLGNIVMASIGPTILNPHTINERLDIDSFKEFILVLEAFLNHLDSANI